MADTEKRSTSATSGTPVSLPRRTEAKTSVATADAKDFKEPPQNYPNEQDKGTGLGEAGFLQPGDEVVRTTRHQQRAEGNPAVTPSNAEHVDNPQINPDAPSGQKK